MIEKLEAELQAAELKCDEEISESIAQNEDTNALFDKLSTKFNKASSRSKQLKEEVATLQKESAELANKRAEMDKIRADEKAVYEKNKPEMEQGLKGVKLGLKILNDCCAKADKAHSSSVDAGSGIIGMLEVIEYDFTKGLREMVAAEPSLASTYQKERKKCN